MAEQKIIKDTEEWLLKHYTFFDDIFEHEGFYYLEFCLREEAYSFINLCCRYDMPFMYSPPYGVAIDIVDLELLIMHYENDKDVYGFNQEVSLDTRPLLKLH